MSKVVSMGVDVIYWPALCEGIPTPSSITVSVFPPPSWSGKAIGRGRVSDPIRDIASVPFFGSVARSPSLPPSPSLPLHISAALSVHPHRHRGLSLYPPSLSLSMWAISVLPCAKEGNLTRLRRAFYHCRSVWGRVVIGVADMMVSV